jgi:hypothetical protein
MVVYTSSFATSLSVHERMYAVVISKRTVANMCISQLRCMLPCMQLPKLTNMIRLGTDFLRSSGRPPSPHERCIASTPTVKASNQSAEVPTLPPIQLLQYVDGPQLSRARGFVPHVCLIMSSTCADVELCTLFGTFVARHTRIALHHISSYYIPSVFLQVIHRMLQTLVLGVSDKAGNLEANFI